MSDRRWGSPGRVLCAPDPLGGGRRCWSRGRARTSERSSTGRARVLVLRWTVAQRRAWSPSLGVAIHPWGRVRRFGRVLARKIWHQSSASEKLNRQKMSFFLDFRWASKKKINSWKRRGGVAGTLLLRASQYPRASAPSPLPDVCKTPNYACEVGTTPSPPRKFGQNPPLQKRSC